MNMDNFSILTFVKTFMESGGIFMWIILFTWLIGLTFSIYKFLTLKSYDINADKLFKTLRNLIVEGKAEDAVIVCSDSRALLPNILKEGIRRHDQGKDKIEAAFETSMSEYVPRLKYKLGYISLLANISTLIGLLGTIQGLILAFASISNADASEKSKLLAEGIAKAMNTTAFGLVSAITLLVIHSILTGKATRIYDKIESVCLKVLDLLDQK